eukprot:TRINITY_DN28474_c0_g1_i1.p1 TRINITY_DN28474_c0_g1~~TRINITY_DN28474_c0_g1_i1.p1  ORF type:complete len:398 (-),score=73.91 TRINITY_DN28474_c0_g1_i1:37-1059(-)
MAEVVEELSRHERFDLEERVYSAMHILRCRDFLPAGEAKPSEVAHLKFVMTKDVFSGSSAASGSRPPPSSSSAKEEREEASPAAGGAPASAASAAPDAASPSEFLPTVGRPGAWWKVCATIIVRESAALESAKVGSVASGGSVQQAGPARRLLGNDVGLVRLPIAYPRGWATVDATALGGGRFLTPRAAAPRWRVVHQSGSCFGDVLVRSAPALDSEELCMLRCGDIVEQAEGGRRETVASKATSSSNNGGSTGASGIVRIAIAIPASALKPPPPAGAVLGQGLDGASQKTRAAPAPGSVGWVSADATASGGPVFLEEVQSSCGGDADGGGSAAVGVAGG